MRIGFAPGAIAAVVLLGLSSCVYPPPPPPPFSPVPPPPYVAPMPPPPPPIAYRHCPPGMHWVRAHRTAAGHRIRAHCAPNRR